MTIFTPWVLRMFGISGIVGSVLFILGDLLYNHIPGTEDSPAQSMSTLPDSRLLGAGVLGLLGCWFYMLATLHVYIALRPVGNLLAFLFLLAYAATMIGYGIAHAAYFAIAAGAKAAAQFGGEVEYGGKLGETFFKRNVYITYVPAGIGSLVMFYAVISGRSLYPRWMVLSLPLLLYLLKTPVTRLIPGRLGELVADSYDNTVLFVFYVLSTCVLWSRLAS